MKLNEITNLHADIEKLLKKYKIENYTIRPDGTVDVDGDVFLEDQRFDKFPIKFGNIIGSFDCVGCTLLTSLEGAPTYVDGYFDCYGCNRLTSLDGAPSFVGGDFSFNGCPNLTSLEGFCTCVSRTMYANWSTIKTGGISLVMSGPTRIFEPTGPFKIIQKYIGRPDDIFECQAELIAAGYEEYAQL